MSRDITNLSVGGLVKFHPENFVDSPDPGIKMGDSVPFSDNPLQFVKEVHDRMPECERWGFTPRYYTTPCAEAPELKALKAKFWKKR